jgi:hypothetical protein
MTRNLITTSNSAIDKKVEDIVFSVLDAWKKTTETWLGISKHLAGYQLDKTKEGKEVWKRVRTKLNENGLKDPTIDKLVVIGKNKVLQDKKYLKQLPASYNMLYELTTLSDDDAVLKQKLEDGDIDQNITIKGVQNLKEKTRIEFKKVTVKKLDNINKKTMIEISMTETYLVKNLDDINDKLHQVKSLFPNSKSVTVEIKGLFKKKLDQGDVDE